MKIRQILFLDDDRYEMLGLVEKLEANDFNVRSFTDPREALEALRSKEVMPALIISDLIMRTRPDETPEQSRYAGVEFCRAVREELKLECPIIVLTVVASPVVHQEASRYAQHVLTKPISPNDLSRTVRNALKI